jgi:PAS domain S-box-containing protein
MPSTYTLTQTEEYMTEISGVQSECIEAGIIENALVMIAVLDKKGKIFAWNHAAESITGFPKAEVIGNANVWKSLYPDKEYRNSVTAKIGENLATKNFIKNLETTIKTKSGDFHIILWNTKEIMWEGESRVIAVGMDISRQKELDAFSRSIIDNANVLMAVMAPHGKVLLWNKGAESITGYPVDEVVGNSTVWKRLYPDAEYRRTITRQITGIITEQRYFENLVTMIVTRTGERRIISWNTKQIEVSGGYHEIAIGRDITEQRQAEEALLAYISEMAMRLKQPVEIVRDNLQETVNLINDGKLTKEEMVTMLKGQVRNATQIAANVQEFQRAIAEKNKEIPEAYRKFLEG